MTAPTDDPLREALRSIAEGNLGDAPWQANYNRIREIARAALAAAPISEQNEDVGAPEYDALTAAIFEMSNGALTSYQALKLAEGLIDKGYRHNEVGVTAAAPQPAPDQAAKECFWHSDQLVAGIRALPIKGGDDAA